MLGKPGKHLEAQNACERAYLEPPNGKKHPFIQMATAFAQISPPHFHPDIWCFQSTGSHQLHQSGKGKDQCPSRSPGFFHFWWSRRDPGCNLGATRLGNLAWHTGNGKSLQNPVVVGTSFDEKIHTFNLQSVLGSFLDTKTFFILSAPKLTS